MTDIYTLTVRYMSITLGVLAVGAYLYFVYVFLKIFLVFIIIGWLYYFDGKK